MPRVDRRIYLQSPSISSISMISILNISLALHHVTRSRELFFMNSMKKKMNEKNDTNRANL